MTRIAIFSLVLATGCSENKIHALSDADAPDGPAIQVDPSILEYGTLLEGDEEIKSFIIASVGEGNLQIESLNIESETFSFTVLTDVEGLVLRTGEVQEVEVAFTPMGAYDQIAQAVIVSNDASHPQVAVDLIGEGAVAELQINPDPLDMGTTYMGCEKNNEVELTNVGTDTLELYEISHTGGAIAMTSWPELPLVLEPEETTSVYFNFEPNELGATEAELSVTSSEPLGVRTAEQLGTGDYAAEYTDEWEVPADPPSDIIFYVDQSCSMDDDQARLAGQFSTFISELNSYSTDWQIIVVNDDNGCNATGGVLTPSATNYISRFQSAVSSGGGWWTEAGLTVTSEAVEMSDGGECNYGFVRPEAMLHIIMVSDEPEQSSSTWNWYVDRVIAKKGSSANVKFSAVAGDYPGGCSTAEAGSGYYQAVSATDGVFLSICSDWATPTNLAMLAAASIQQAAFELSATPVPSTIRVWVNGTERLNLWHYDEGDNTVVFDDGIPEEGDNIRIEYGGLTDCD